MGRNRKDLSTTSKVAGKLSFGALARSVPRAVVDEELEKAGRMHKRIRALPAHVMVYYVMAMCIHSQIGVVEVLRWILEEARGLFGLGELVVATSGAISSARARLGSGVLEALYRRIVGPVALKRTRGAWHGDLRVVALDGSTLELQDTAENARHYGYAAVGRGECAFPKLRFAALVETGTQVLFGARMGPYAKSEQALAREVLDELKPGMLCLAEQLFYGFELWKQACASGAELLWRVKNNTRLPVEEALPDGSWLSTVHADNKARRAKCGRMRVRVIEYRLQGSGAPDEKYLLITTLLEHKKHPAGVLAGLYPQHWEIETAYDEFKTHLRGGSVVLRSKTPELVEQEFYGFMLAHYSVCELMHQAALANDIDPGRLSFTHSIEVIKRKLPACKAGFSPSEDAHVPTVDNP